ncbi:polysaccharide biosynthesis tyrosine autokinase [Aeromicrobium sp. P5_D10]
MTLTDYVRRISQRWRVIVLTMAVLVALATVITLLITPKYESRARVFVSNSGQNQDISSALGAGIYAQQKVLSYAAIASSEKMAETVIADLNLNVSPAEIASQVKTSVEFGTVLVTIVVTDESADRASAIANSIITNYNRVVAEVDVADGESSPITVSAMETPTLPTSPTSPKIGLNIIAALFAGFLLGIALAALRDLLDDTVKTVSDLEDIELATLGPIPTRSAKKRGRNGEAPSTLISFSENTPAAEAFRQLRVNLQFASLDRQPRKLLVTSTGPGEGKSFVCANLAAVYAATGMRVALVDLDLRRPMLAERLGLERSVGVTSVLLRRAAIEEALQPVNDSHLMLLSSGPLPPNPADVLSTEVLAEVLDKLANDFDIVILDSPPAGMFADARQLTSMVDGTIVVSRYRHTKKGPLADTVKGLRDVGGNVLGVILNRAPTKGQGDYDQYGYNAYQPTNRHNKRAKT